MAWTHGVDRDDVTNPSGVPVLVFRGSLRFTERRAAPRSQCAEGFPEEGVALRQTPTELHQHIQKEKHHGEGHRD